MRISVNLSIDIDPEVWDELYGTTATTRRLDVLAYVREQVLQANEAIRYVELKNTHRVAPHMPSQ
jgi:hypothetical protein